jgi:hypothetical protein
MSDIDYMRKDYEREIYKKCDEEDREEEQRGNMLTLEALKDMPPHEHFATGVAIDNSSNINITNSGRLLRWVAVRGGMHDWAIYIGWFDRSEDELGRNGDKLHSKENIRKLVPCTDEAFNMYRF